MWIIGWQLHQKTGPLDASISWITTKYTNNNIIFSNVMTNQLAPWILLIYNPELQHIAHSTTKMKAEHRSDIEFTIDKTIAHPHGWAMGCLLWVFWRNWLHYNGIALYNIAFMPSHSLDVMWWLLAKCHLGPLLLTWFNFNPSMDK